MEVGDVGPTEVVTNADIQSTAMSFFTQKYAHLLKRQSVYEWILNINKHLMTNITIKNVL